MITKEREQVLRGCLHGSNPEEREFVRTYVKRIGLCELFPPAARKAKDENDYEGAILARQERQV
jgi:hypothetical protein